MEELKQFIELHRPSEREVQPLMWLISEVTLRGKKAGLNLDQIMDLIAII